VCSSTTERLVLYGVEFYRHEWLPNQTEEKPVAQNQTKAKPIDVLRHMLVIIV
jgi:hypothetical protein